MPVTPTKRTRTHTRTHAKRTRVQGEGSGEFKGRVILRRSPFRPRACACSQCPHGELTIHGNGKRKPRVFVPVRRDQIYCSEGCGTFERVKRWRERERVKREKERGKHGKGN